jgi:hypothetical protein
MPSRLLLAVLVALAASSAAQAADIRRVTGLDASNKAIVQFDERLLLAAGPNGIAGLNPKQPPSVPDRLSGSDLQTRGTATFSNGRRRLRGRPFVLPWPSLWLA